MGITVTLRGGSGDMLKGVYDPNLDGVVALAQTESDMTKAVYDTEGNSKISAVALPLKNGDSIKNTADVTKSAMTLSMLNLGLKDGVSDNIRAGFKHTVADEWIKSVKVKISHMGTNMAHTPVYMCIRKVSDDISLVQKGICYIDDQSAGTAVEYTSVFTNPIYVNCECYFSVECAVEAAWAESYMKLWGRTAGGTQNGWFYNSLTSTWTQVPANNDVYAVIDYMHQYKAAIDYIMLTD